MDRPVLSVASAIAQCAAARPQSPAVIEPNGNTINYCELWAQMEELSQRLREAGVGFGERVALLLPQGSLEVLAFAGVLNRHVAIPLPAKMTTVEVEFTLRRLSASALVVSPQYVAEAEAAIQMGLTILVARKGESAKDWEIRRSASPSQARAISSDAIMLLVTSATTANSKVVPLTALNIDSLCVAYRDLLHLTAADRALLMIPMSHSAGKDNVLSQLFVGGSVIATGGFDTNAYLRWLNELRPTWYLCSPTVHQAAFVQLMHTPPQMPVSLRFILSGTAPLPNEVKQGLEQILHVPVFNAYGMTETALIAGDGFLSGSRIPNSAGRSCGMEIGIMNSSGELLPEGDEGEIVVRGPAVFSGYEDNADANRCAFQDGWFRTGDAGRLDQEGNLFMTGRLKEMINHGGEKVQPGEVDAVLASHPAVLEAAAFAVPHPTLGEDVACAIVLRKENEAEVSAQELRRYAAQRLSAYKVPHRICFVAQIPRGELGKPQRWLLAERLGNKRRTPPSPDELLAKRIEDSIFYAAYEIWSRILDRDDLGFDEDFFEAGGDSLAAIKMLAEVDQRFGSQASAATARFIDEPTLNNLVALVNEAPQIRPCQNDVSEIRIFPVRAGGSGRQLFCLPAYGEEGLYFRRLARHLHGEMDLSIVRPANTQYSRSLFTFEQCGAETAVLIRQVQPEGPYFVSGYCYGGIVAVETVRQLSLDGQDARLILFDVSMPGYPAFLRQWRTLVMSARRRWRVHRNGNRTTVARDLLYCARRVAWDALTPLRRLLTPFERTPGILKFLDPSGKDIFPFYRARPLDTPILHFLSTGQSYKLDYQSRFGWRKIARCGIDECFVSLDHANVFNESNIPVIVETLLQWCSTPRVHYPDRHFPISS